MKARVIFLLASALILAAAFALAPRADSAAAPDGSSGGATIVVATDLHYLAPELTDNGEFFTEMVETADGKAMQHIDELVRAFARQIIDERPDALILSGDLSFNGETASHEALAGILAQIEESGVPVYVIPGNHDIGISTAARFIADGYELVDSPDEAEFEDIYRGFGYGEALSRDGASLSYTARPVSGVRLVMLDVNTRSNPGVVGAETLGWLESQLAEARDAGETVIAVSHQNIYAHNSLMTTGYIIENGGTLYSLYAKYGVICNLAGHIHLQHTADDGRGLPEIVTSSLAVNPNQYGVLTIDGGQAEYRTESVDVSAWAAGQGLDDPELLDFAGWSREFFYGSAVNQALRQLGGAANAEALAELYAEANTNYFAGRGDLTVWDDELFDAWSGHGFFIPIYLETMRQDNIDHTHMAFQFK